MALTNNTISMVLDRSLKELPVYRCWQATPLKVSCAFPSGSADSLSDVTTLTLEIRQSLNSSGAALASKEISTPFGSTPWVFDLESSDTNLTIPDDIDSLNLFIMVVATLSTGEIDVISAGKLVMLDNNFSGASVNPPGIVAYASSSFKTISVSGEDDIVADIPADNLTFVAGTGVTIETNATTNEITINSTAGGSSLVSRITTSAENATDTSLHLAYVPLALTIPSDSTSGFYGSIQSHTPGTVKLVLPTGWEIDYVDLPSGQTGRPVVAFRGGRIDYLIVAPGRILIRGDYVSTADTWHPTDAGDNLLGYWQAGPDIVDGGFISFPCADTESVTFTSDLMMRWEAKFGSRANARWVYDWLANVESGGDQGTSPGDYAPILVADSTFAGGYAYKIREGSTTSHIMRAKDSAGDIAPTAPCRIYIAIRQTGTLPQSATTLLRVNDQAAYSFGSKSALWWRASPYGYQFVTNTSGGSFGAKGSGAYNFTTHESTTNAILLTLLIDANGGGTLYSGTQLISNPLTSNTAATLSFLQFYTGLNSRIGGIAVINGTASDLTAEITAMEALLIA